jgi:MoaA/NifB/PqqE/SkfB family radical SAM enzyme
MDIKTVSLAVPTGCPNNCKFCVSNMRNDDYKKPNDNVYWKRLEKRLIFAMSNGFNKLNFTGTGEPLNDKNYFEKFKIRNLNRYFEWMEVQTSGIYLNKEFLNLFKDIGISTINLSVIDLWNDNNNHRIMETPIKLKYNLENLCNKITNESFILRITIPITDVLRKKVDSPEQIFNKVKSLGARQLTLRNLHLSDNNTDQDKWIEKHALNELNKKAIRNYINNNYISRLQDFDYNQNIKMIDGLSVMIDKDCTGHKMSNKYLIIRENGR